MVNNEIILLFPRLFTFILFSLLGLKILNLQRTYTLNRVYCAAFCIWALFNLFDATLLLIAPLSETAFYIANFFRDIQMSCLIIFAFLIYLSYRIIKEGTQSIVNTRLFIEIAIFCVIIIWIITLDRIEVWNTLNQKIPASEIKDSVEDLRGVPIISTEIAILAIIPILFYVYAMIQMLILGSKVDDLTLKKRMTKRAIGLLLIPTGVIYFIIQNVLNWDNIIFILAGYIFYVLASILVWSSQNKEKKA